MRENNQQEIEFWNGGGAERWVAFQERIDPCIRPFGEAALATLAELRPLAGARVIDVGCGCGDTSLALAERVGRSGSVIGVDVSAPMLARARERGAGLPNLRFAVGDASAIDVGPADALYSRFGMMFFADPVAAFTHLRRQLVPGAPIAFACWKALAENPWAGVPLRTVAEVVGAPPPPPPDEPGPFAFAAEARVREILERAGFSAVTHLAVHRPFPLGDSLESALTQVTQMGPASRLLSQASDELRTRASEALRERLAELAPRFELDAAAWTVCARA